MAEKIDLRKQLKTYYSPRARFEFVEVPAFNFLMLDGQGNPNTSQQFQDSMQVLFSLAYTLKFHFKQKKGWDYTVMGVEGLWWADDMQNFLNGSKDTWKWTLMILQPDFITAEDVELARQQILSKKGDLPRLDDARFETFHEGLSAQVMYTGAYADEGPTIQGLHQFIQENGCERVGKHHEIYMSDFRRVAPEKLKTIIRQPARKLP